MSFDIAVETNGLCHLCSTIPFFFGHISSGCPEILVLLFDHFSGNLTQVGTSSKGLIVAPCLMQENLMTGSQNEPHQTNSSSPTKHTPRCLAHIYDFFSLRLIFKIKNAVTSKYYY